MAIGKTCTVFLRKRLPIHTTMLELVWAESELTKDDELVVQNVARVVNSGRVRLMGTFKGRRVIIG